MHREKNDVIMTDDFIKPDEKDNPAMGTSTLLGGTGIFSHGGSGMADGSMAPIAEEQERENGMIGNFEEELDENGEFTQHKIQP